MSVLTAENDQKNQNDHDYWENNNQVRLRQHNGSE